MSKIKTDGSKVTELVYDYYMEKKKYKSQYDIIITNMVEKRLVTKDNILEREYMIYHLTVIKRNFIMMPNYYWEFAEDWFDANDEEDDMNIIYELTKFFRYIDIEIRNIKGIPDYISL